MANSIVISTKGLKKNYGPVRALRGVNLEVRKGEIFGFLGPNGSGKTTTIRCFLDLIRPNGGAIRIFDLDPQKQPVEIRSRSGYLPGELHFDEGTTVENALRYFNSLRDNKADWEFVRGLARRMDLDLKSQIKNLSKGNKQKVGVIQALMHRPELLLLDEPTSGMDPLVQREVLRMVGEARDAGTTVFFSSHVLSEVEEITDRVGIIREGTIAEVADTKSLIRRALRTVEIRFRKSVDASGLGSIAGVSFLGPKEGQVIRLQMEGEMDGLIKALAAFPVSDFATERPSLEEIFLAYYAPQKKQGD
jgi:ABC-2 type transport system ATP-binding protein